MPSLRSMQCMRHRPPEIPLPLSLLARRPVLVHRLVYEPRLLLAASYPRLPLDVLGKTYSSPFFGLNVGKEHLFFRVTRCSYRLVPKGLRTNLKVKGLLLLSETCDQRLLSRCRTLHVRVVALTNLKAGSEYPRPCFQTIASVANISPKVHFESISCCLS